MSSTTPFDPKAPVDPKVPEKTPTKEKTKEEAPKVAAPAPSAPASNNAAKAKETAGDNPESKEKAEAKEQLNKTEAEKAIEDLEKMKQEVDKIWAEAHASRQGKGQYEQLVGVMNAAIQAIKKEGGLTAHIKEDIQYCKDKLGAVRDAVGWAADKFVDAGKAIGRGVDKLRGVDPQVDGSAAAKQPQQVIATIDPDGNPVFSVDGQEVAPGESNEVTGAFEEYLQHQHHMKINPTTHKIEYDGTGGKTGPISDADRNTVNEAISSQGDDGFGKFCQDQKLNVEVEPLDTKGPNLVF